MQISHKIHVNRLDSLNIELQNLFLMHLWSLKSAIMGEAIQM